MEINNEQEGPQGLIDQQNSITGLSNSMGQASEEEEEEATCLPGFTGLTPGPIRRSRRISEKNLDIYISPEEKARLNTRPDSVPVSQKNPRKKQQQTHIKPDYLKSYDLLTLNHAEAVLMAAGIELEGEVATQVKEIIAL